MTYLTEVSPLFALAPGYVRGENWENEKIGNLENRGCWLPAASTRGVPAIKQSSGPRHVPDPEQRQPLALGLK